MTALLVLAAGVGVLHTLLGPDHYLPLVGLGRLRDWSLRRSLAITLACGVVHCLSSLLLVLALGWAATSMSWVQGLLSGMALTAACLLMALGLVMLLAVWRRRRMPKLGTPALLLVFAVGPCEWLIPQALATYSAQGMAAAILVATVFSLATLLTMLGCVALGLRALPQMPQLRMQTVTGLGMLACGLAMLVGF